MTDKYTENETKINEYTNQIINVRDTYSALRKIDNIAITTAIISGFASLLVSPIATIPLVISLASSYFIQKKQDTYTSDINDLTVLRGILETENRKILDKEIEDYRESQKYYSINQDEISDSKKRIPGVYDTSSDSLENLAIEHETSNTKEILNEHKETKQKVKTKNL